MSSNAFMQPALPQTPAPDLNRAPGKSSAAFKSSRLGESADQRKNFSATLNWISDRKHQRNSNSTAANKPAVRSRRSDTESVKPIKMSKTNAFTRDDIEENGASVSGKESRSIHPWPAFGLMPHHLLNGSLAAEPPSDSTSGPSLRMLTDLIGHLQPQGQEIQSERVGIGPFEQLQANISPEALNRFFFEQLAAWAMQHQDSAGHTGKPAQDGTLNGQQESSGVNVKAPLNPLPPMQAMIGSAGGLNPDTSGSGGLKMAAGLDGAHLNEDLFLKMTTTSQTGKPAQDGTLNGQQESSGVNVKAPLNPLPPMQAMIGSAGGLNPDTSGSGGLKMAAGLDGAHLNEDLFLKMTTTSQTGKPAQDGTLNGQQESSGVNVKAPLNPLPPMQAMIGSAGGLNPDTSGSGGLKMAAGLDGAHLNEDLFLKMTTPSQTAETGISENAKMAAAGHNGRLSFWASDDSNSETLLEAQARQLSENSQTLKNQAALKVAAEQPANPDSTPDGVTAKTPEEVFGIKRAVPKSEILPIHALGNKINQIDGYGKDSSFLFSQDQMPQDLARIENAVQRSKAAQRGLMSQTLNQIVQKAVLSFNNGQHEVQIDLKPEFLGHIRMQIVTESQQVAVRIVAELPFVKDMLESNLNQLKAELQAQGLKVDELEVSVAHDSGADDDKHQKAAKVLRARALKNSRLSDDAATEEQTDVRTSRGDGIAETAIDYFA